MSEQLERFASCEQITEWVTPHDERLVRVTGMQPPIDAQHLRRPWHEDDPKELSLIANEVGRLLIPKVMTSKARAAAYGKMIRVEFDVAQDWPQILPKTEETLIFEHELNDCSFRGHAAIAVCGQTAALAVIAMEEIDNTDPEDVFLNFVVQPIRQDKFEQIIRL